MVEHNEAGTRSLRCSGSGKPIFTLSARWMRGVVAIFSDQEHSGYLAKNDIGRGPVEIGPLPNDSGCHRGTRAPRNHKIG